jgi:hypothetical protein
MESTVMVFHALLYALKGSRTPSPAGTRRPRQPARKRTRTRCTLETLEDRSLPSGSPLGAGALRADYGRLPLAFEVNQGQAPAGVDFQSFGAGYALSLSAGEAVLSLRPGPGVGGSQSAADVLHLQLVGANAAAVSGLDPLVTRSNYLVGSDPSQWRRNIPNFDRVDYHNVYPGIDVAYYGNQGRLEYDFTVAPGADPSAIRLAIQGARGLALDGAGDLVISTAAGDVIEEAPVIYQVVNGVRQPVSGRYVLLGSAGSATPQVGFQVGAYDHARPLVIDPVLSYSFATSSYGWAIAVDGSGDAYLTGPGPGNAVMVGKLNPTGTAFVYLTYLGDNTGKEGWGDGIAVDSAGNAYITGEPSGNFPTTANAFSTTASGLFMTELDPSGANLLYSTFIPGGDNQYTGTVNTWGVPGGIAVDGAGNIYVTGTADSGFTTTPNAYQQTLGGSGKNAFLAEFNPALSGAASLVYGSFLGGGGEEGFGIAVDSSGNAYITGEAGSATPTTPGAFQRTPKGWDAFVAKFNTSLSGAASLVYSTLLGGSKRDGMYPGGGPAGAADPFNPGLGIAVDSTGAAYIAGEASSTDFPVTPGAFQTSFAGGGSGIGSTYAGDAFITKLNPSGSALVYSTYLGGSGNDGATGIGIDAYGNATVTGWTKSANFPVQNPIQAQNGASYDGFVATVNASGSGLLFSTYLTAPAQVYGTGVALDPGGNIYVTAAVGSYTSGLVYKITSPAGPSFGVSGFPASITAGTSGTITVTALNPDGSVNTGYSGTVHFSSSDPHAVLPADATLTNGTGTFSVTLDTAGAQSITVSDLSNPGISGSETGITVSPAAATHFVLSGPTSVSAGTSFSLTVTAVDAYSNTATGYRGTVHFTDSVGGATLPANYTFTATDKGVHTFTGLKLKTKGWQTITVTDTLNSSILGSWTIDVL